MRKNIKLGKTTVGQNIYLNAFDNQHMILTGRTRSGKSVALYSILSQMRDMPVAVCGLDPTGVLLNPLGERMGGSQFRVLTLQDSERVGAVMDQIISIMDARIRTLLDQRRDKFTDFSRDFRQVVVVLEEYPGTLTTLAAIDKASGARAADRIETKVRAAVQRIALEGLKVGVKLIVASQRADANILTGVLRSQLTTRISFAQDADGLRMLHESLTPEQIEQAARFKPGHGFVEIPGETELTRFRADVIDYEKFVKHFA